MCEITKKKGGRNAYKEVIWMHVNIAWVTQEKDAQKCQIERKGSKLEWF